MTHDAARALGGWDADHSLQFFGPIFRIFTNNMELFPRLRSRNCFSTYKAQKMAVIE